MPKINTTATTPFKSEFGEYAFIGAYDPVTLLTDGTQRIINNVQTLDIPTLDNNQMKGIRAYFQVPAGSDVIITINDTLTDINSINADDTSSTVIYNLSGVKVANQRLSKGVYIINGKKIVVK